MNDHESPLTPDEAMDAELSAYLDGEVDPSAREAIEQKLSTHQEYRERLQLLQSSWDLLDQLPSSDTDDSFTRSTVAMAALQIDPSSNSASPFPRRLADKPWRRMAACVAASLLIGYLSIAMPTRIAHRRAVADLPFIENFEMYLYVDSVEFLLLLDEEDLFTEELDELL